MSRKAWPQKGEFINMILAWGLAHQLVSLEDLQFDGVAGENFDEIVSGLDYDDADEVITMALHLQVPVKGLIADGELGEKWKEVVALCKEE
jgi:hypothetical protein